MYSTYSTYGLSSTSSSAAGLADMGIWGIIAAVIAVIGGIVAYFLFVNKKNTYKGFLSWLHKFLNFKTLFIETLMKIGYIVAALFITLGSFGIISTSFLGFVFMLIGGNLILRVMYEFVMMTRIIVRNTTDINAKLGEKKESKK